MKHFDVVSDTENITYQSNSNKAKISVKGWAGSIKYGSPLENISIYLNSNFLGNATLGIKREDIVNESDCVNCGWKCEFNISKLEQGLHLLEVFTNEHKLIPYACRVFQVDKNNKILLISGSNTLINNTIPPPNLRNLVSGTEDIEGFIRTGVLGRITLERSLKKLGYEINCFESILDFGCGRVLMYLQDFKGPKFFGVDYNNDLIKWNQKNLVFAKFYKNNTSPLLSFEESKFDLIYSFSVFTHLSISLQKNWLNELTRILKKRRYLNSQNSWKKL